MIQLTIAFRGYGIMLGVWINRGVAYNANPNWNCGVFTSLDYIIWPISLKTSTGRHVTHFPYFRDAPQARVFRMSVKLVLFRSNIFPLPKCLPLLFPS